ncbi:MAG TPA: trypsin-like serine protease [Polyangiaceae bacterium]|jgi:MYXO-CTERM domain-containing protein
MDAPPIKAAKQPAARRSGGLPSWITFPWIAVAPLLGACGGTGTAYDAEPTASSSSAIYGGVLDNDASQNASVVAIEVGAQGDESFYLCSGTLIAPNVVLTARHCVSTQLTTSPICDQDGNTTNGPHFGDDIPVDQINVFATAAIYQGEAPSSIAKTLYHPSGSIECNADVALIVLATSISAVAPSRVRIASAVNVGESTRAVGFGANNESSVVYGTRYRKDDLPILAVGSTVSASQTPLGNNEFELGGESTCSGDSGGPVLDETTNAIVGVLSRGPADCTVTDGHIYSSLEGFAPLFQQAFAEAGGSWIDENAALPDGGTASSSSGTGGGSGGGSGSGSGSSSGNGAMSSSGGYSGGVNLHSGAGSGCSAVGGEPPGETVFGTFLLGAFALLSVRRRVR